MTPERVLAVVATIVVGGLVALQPPVNSLLAKRLDVIGAACVSTFVSASFLLIVYLVLHGGFGGLAEAAHAPPWQLTGGLVGAALVSVSLVTVTRLGAGGVVAATVLGQLAVSTALDSAGVLGLERTPVTPARIAGFALLLCGTLLVVRA